MLTTKIRTTIVVLAIALTGAVAAAGASVAETSPVHVTSSPSLPR
jgi:hypothetical protein